MQVQTLQIEFGGLSGETRKMSILKMGHRDYWETFHEVIQAISGGLKIGHGKVSFNPLAILQSISFEKFEKIALKTLAYGVLDGVGTVKDPFECPHFLAHPDELYAAVYAAFTAQNPEMFPKPKGPETPPADSAPPESAEAKGTVSISVK
jgi:hypothetical protein